MADVVRVGLPVRFHLREEVGPEDSLRFVDCPFDGFTFLGIHLAVVCFIEPVESGGY